jgi:signal transduction histidine kinase
MAKQTEKDPAAELSQRFAKIKKDTYQKFNLTFVLMTIIPILAFVQILAVYLFDINILAGKVGLILFFILIVGGLGYYVGYAIIRSILEQMTVYADVARDAYGKLRETHEQLVQIEKMATIGIMAASVAHELRNPLAVIKTAINNLDRYLKDKDERIVGHILNINKMIWEGDRIIYTLLNYSRLGKPILEKADINAWVEEALSNICVEFPDHNGKVIKKFGKISNFRIDQTQIKEVLQNIITNAYESMVSGGDLILSTKYLANRKMVEISIADHGCGIYGGNLEKLEKPFFTTKAKGIGLGLSLSFRIVRENHMGTIHVKSKVGKGTVFTIKLPASRTMAAYAKDLHKESRKNAEGEKLL